jgi:hypothetical protein
MPDDVQSIIALRCTNSFFNFCETFAAYTGTVGVCNPRWKPYVGIFWVVGLLSRIWGSDGSGRKVVFVLEEPWHVDR